MEISDLLSIEPFSWRAIFTVLLCGSIIGIERQLRGKPIGIRTSTLITFGTYVFVASAASLNSTSADPSRVIGQVITGIGFLGAGVIMSRDGVVVGVTSAASIWILASIGVVIGMHHYLTAIILAFLVVGILSGVEWLESSFQSLSRGVHSRYQKWRRKTDKRSDTDT
ncbi:MAG: MgtC/SapB family protein, partial [Calditrichaeota bacterium]|nr:MgtC/SapB family protein [Calditrichota bacterium]